MSLIPRLFRKKNSCEHISLEEALNLKPGSTVVSNSSFNYPYVITRGEKYLVVNSFPVYEDTWSSVNTRTSYSRLMSFGNTVPVQIRVILKNERGEEIELSHLNLQLPK